MQLIMKRFKTPTIEHIYNLKFGLTVAFIIPMGVAPHSILNESWSIGLKFSEQIHLT